jgi:hypothetical protein
MGISNSQATADLTAKKIQSGEASFISHAGDISYADNRAGINNGSIYEGVLNDFYNEVQPSSAYGAYMTSSGYVYTLCPSRSYITLKRGYIILKRSYGFS